MESWLERIKNIRARNNELWMEILEIALKSNPKRTKMVLKEITENDERINSKLKGLIK